MTDGDGGARKASLRRRPYKQTLQDGDDPSVIAKRLTLAIWRSDTGGNALGGFNRRLAYPKPFSCLVKAYTHKHAGEEARVRPPANLRVRD